MLKEIGCDLAQGYLYSRPVAADAIEKLLRDNRAASVSSTLAKSASAAFS
jgi:EAL domain-containing protein (putative c-di-GMP-specific phosphodiesterase class I)